MMRSSSFVCFLIKISSQRTLIDEVDDHDDDQGDHCGLIMEAC